jgi:hypothetical protein
MDHIDMRRIAEIAETYGVQVVLTPLGFRISRAMHDIRVEHLLAYDLLWQANNPVGIFEYEARCTSRHLEEAVRDNEQHLTVG